MTTEGSTDTAQLAKGLEGVVAGTTAKSSVDGVNGRLVYAGYAIQDLAEHATFPEVAALLWNGTPPAQAELAALHAELAAARKLPDPVLALLRTLPLEAHPMELLRTVVSTLGLYDPDRGDQSPEANRRKAVRLTSQVSTTIAAIHRLRKGEEPFPPQKDLGHSANFLYMLNGEVPDPFLSRVYDVCLILHADHGWNASTFSARVTTATLSDMYSAVTSAIGTLKGPLHGGANQKVMEMLLEIGEPERAEAHIRGLLDRHERVMGFGHRVYKVMDPRAPILKRFSRELGEKTGQPQWHAMSEKIEALMQAEKGLNPNVDFYSASAFYSLGIPIDLFSTIFASSRVVGWTAHILEQLADNRLIRPRGQYTGPKDLVWPSLASRD